MVKRCSPFVLSGVVDSSFKRPDGGPGAPLETLEEANVWPRPLRSLAKASSQASLAKALPHKLTTDSSKGRESQDVLARFQPVI